MARHGHGVDPVTAHRRRLVLETVGLVVLALITLVLVMLALQR